MKRFILLLLIILPSIVFSQNLDSIPSENRLFFKVYGGISSLLSDKIEITTPSRNYTTNYDYEPGFNVGFSIGYFVFEKFVIQTGFENRSDRLLLSLLSSNTSAGEFELRTRLKTNTAYINMVYYFKDGDKLKSYAGLGGAILQDVSYEFYGEDFSNSGQFGFRFLIGADYKIQENWALNFEANYNSFETINLSRTNGTLFNLEYTPLTLNLGIIYYPRF